MLNQKFKKISFMETEHHHSSGLIILQMGFFLTLFFLNKTSKSFGFYLFLIGNLSEILTLNKNYTVK